MTSPSPDESDDPYGLLMECLDDPEQGKARLPNIVGLFESDERVTRLCAAWACCLVVTETEDKETIDYLVRRLSDRLSEAYVSLELTTTLDYISTSYPEQVEAILDEMDEEERENGEIPLPRVGNFTRANYFSRDHSRDGVGRTRIAGEDTEGDPREAYADDERDERDRDDGQRPGDNEEDTDDNQSEEPAPGRSGPMSQERSEVDAIAAESSFEKLHILATRERNRYADVYQALVGTGGEEAAVALRLLHEPSTTSEAMRFRHNIGEILTDWGRVDDHPHVVSVLDWGIDPRPWLATEFTAKSLSDVDSLSTADALSDAVKLSDAVSSLHHNGVVHGGIDPGNVIYPDDIVNAEARTPPFLDNIGLLEVFRFHFKPALMLDPRFAAPEYFNSGYGRIGPATDIYQTGAVIYYMLTGQPPFTGQFQDVREGVLEREPPAPSTVADSVPTQLDSIVSKAMAKQKITRYETVEHLHQELLSLGGGGADG